MGCINSHRIIHKYSHLRVLCVITIGIITQIQSTAQARVSLQEHTHNTHSPKKHENITLTYTENSFTEPLFLCDFLNIDMYFYYSDKQRHNIHTYIPTYIHIYIYVYVHIQYFIYRKHCYMFQLIRIIFRESYPFHPFVKVIKIIRVTNSNKIARLKCIYEILLIYI